MDGVLLIDKPSGPTSHDVVARLRRTAGERAIGHTGTLDPLATGVMVLVLGRATRLAAFLSSGDKTYEAVIRLGLATDTDDAQGRQVGAAASSLPDDVELASALGAFRGTFDQYDRRTRPRRSPARRLTNWRGATGPLFSSRYRSPCGCLKFSTAMVTGSQCGSRSRPGSTFAHWRATWAGAWGAAPIWKNSGALEAEGSICHAQCPWQRPSGSGAAWLTR